MDKNAIKKYAVWARRELISRVSQKALQYGISEDSIVSETAASVNGVVLSSEEVKQCNALIERIKSKGYEQVMEEAAYTWFNRFIALRFMEVNGYLPSHVRVFTDEDNNFKPQILAEAINLELDGLDMERVYALKDANDNDTLFKYLIIVQCNALNPILPGMFRKIDDYTVLLFPDNLLREGSVIQQMIEIIPEEDWKDAVQIIGWLYQYYNSEKKDEVFAALKKNVKITKENIPAATQLFTPDWIVRYMVENSLGRLWLEGHPDTKDQLLPTREEQSAYAAGNRDPEDTKWHYYLEEAEQEPDVQAQLAQIRKEYAALTPEQIKVIDACCGSGHILAYMFDVLMQIYEVYGYSVRDAVRSIVENNIYGLDIDDRAAQLAYFAVMMKACQYDRRFLTRKDEDDNPYVPQLHVYAIVESNDVNRDSLKYFGWSMSDTERNMALSQLTDLLDSMQDAKEYGSILVIKDYDWELLYRFVGTVAYTGQLDFDTVCLEKTKEELWNLVKIAAILAQKYDAVVTNPPYMGGSGMSGKLSEYVKKHYPDSKSDLFAVFIEHCGKMTAKNRYQAMITQHAWMFLSSFEKLRDKLQQVETVNMAHLGPRAFEEIGGEVVQTTSFVMCNSHIKGYRGTYCHLIDPTTQQGKEDLFLARKNNYVTEQDNFSRIPGKPVVYELPKCIMNTFGQNTCLKIADSRCGMNTGDNDRFLKMWYEVCYNDFLPCGTSTDEFLKSGAKYAVYNKGGTFRKWYGNLDYIIRFDKKHYDILLMQGNHLPSRQFYFRACITWSDFSTKGVAFRYEPEGSVFDGCAATAFPYKTEMLNYLLGMLNSSFVARISPMLNPTLHFKLNDFGKIPFIYDTAKADIVSELVVRNIYLSRTDWDSFETSWDFQQHPLIRCAAFSMQEMMEDAKQHICDMNYIEEAYTRWCDECYLRFNKLKANEEELNRLFIDIYGLQDELTPEVEDKDVTVRKADLGRDIRSFISYAVGCMFGRYSLDEPGLAYAGGVWDANKYKTFPADKDNIIPICDDEYFDDDIVGRFVEFVKTVYGAETLDENLKFIADALGGKGQPKDVIRSYFMNDFFNDHCKIYQKRPIYWLFDSGKKGGFRALVYMHRYQPDTIARMRTDYVHEQQARYRTAIADLEQRIASASTGERVKLSKRLKTLQEQAAEIHGYEEKIHHLADRYIAIDLDDGVKNNYEIFKDVLAKIK